jgi:hypothetical protein
MPEATGNADLVRVGAGRLYVGAFEGASAVDLPVTIAEAVADATLTTTGNWRPLGFTTEGSSLTYSQTADGVEVAERLRPVKSIITAVDMNFEFTMAEISVENLALATNAPASSIQATVAETTFSWPKSGGSNRTSILWVADDDLEALVLVKAFAGGDISIPRRKGVEPAAIGLTFTIEENASVDTTINAITAKRDAYYIAADSLVS